MYGKTLFGSVKVTDSKADPCAPFLVLQATCRGAATPIYV